MQNKILLVTDLLAWITLNSLPTTPNHSGDCFVYPISICRALQITGGNILGSLVLLCPLPDSFEVSACVCSVEIYKGCRRCSIPPDLAQHPDVDNAHELLSENVQTMG